MALTAAHSSSVLGSFDVAIAGLVLGDKCSKKSMKYVNRDPRKHT